MSKLCVGKSLWGVEEAGDPSKWDSLFTRLKTEGYTHVETILIFDANKDPKLFNQLLRKHGLRLIIQLHTASDWASFDYCSTADLDVHIDSFRALLSNALTHQPTIVNVHSGHDSWDVSTAVEYFTRVHQIQLEMLTGEHQHVTLVHETHRQRLLYSPYQTRDVLQHPAIVALSSSSSSSSSRGNGCGGGRGLRLNIDISHWVCVCENLFRDDGKGRDAWWPAILALAAEHCSLIHGRVGYAEGPQVVDPRQEGYSAEVAAHAGWWKAIMRAQRRQGVKSVLVTEHGPSPYQIYNLPDISSGSGSGSGESALSDEQKGNVLWDINNFVKQLAEREWAKLEQEQGQ